MHQVIYIVSLLRLLQHPRGSVSVTIISTGSMKERQNVGLGIAATLSQALPLALSDGGRMQPVILGGG